MQLVQQVGIFSYNLKIIIYILLILLTFSLTERDYKVNLARSGSFMSSSINPSAAGHHSKSYRKSSAEANGGAASDDSMHEKYFKSVENTPLSRRRHASSVKTAASSSGSNKKHSSDSSPQSPISPPHVSFFTYFLTILVNPLIFLQQTKSKHQKSSSNAMTPASTSPYAASISPSLHSPNHLQMDGVRMIAHTPTSHFKQDSASMELLNLEKLSINKSTGASSPHPSEQSTSNVGIKNFPSSDNIGMLTHSSRGSSDSRGKHKTRVQHAQEHFQGSSKDNRSSSAMRPNSASLDKHSRHSNERYYDNKREKRESRRSGGGGGGGGGSSNRHHKQHYLNADNSDVEYDNGNTSPLYSNWDQVRIMRL